MIGLLRMVAWIVVLSVIVSAAVWYLGPREPVVTDADFDQGALGDDLDAYFQRVEADVPDLREAARKRVVWAGAPGAVTPLAILYLHGFSASAEEIRPVPDIVADALGANLIYTRLTGHGRDGAAMAEASVQDWMGDVAEGLAAARQVGERVVILSVSTGGTLAALVPFDAAMSEDLAGIAFVSPNFRIANPAAALLTWPMARTWVPLVTGQDRAFEPQNPEHAAHWTTRYPTRALMPMAAVVRHASGRDYGGVDVPALFAFSPDDAIVDQSRTREIAEGWGGPARIEPITLTPGNDPDNHVIAGDILSPGMTQPVAEIIIDWAGGL
ncbi:alpha/beta hydrolase [Anianabacter salinae]|uniref:alpha/beta hydrolase n=1 Tax=Anianabacter salinae TaxID=2851023 RepID=UPI00225E664F|nr:alpha/beta hydrolase [Anianabacter salinae]MBV0912571.1 alpha/beta hydrolase [Anianabacter salinae]